MSNDNLPLIHSPKANDAPLVVSAGGDVKEALEHTQEAEAYLRESVIKNSFNGDKLAADAYIADRYRQRTRR